MTSSVSRDQILGIVLSAMEIANLTRVADEQLEVTPEAPIFGPKTSLDSLGLVALLLDIEDTLLDEGLDVSLNTEHAISRKSSPFRDVPALVEYIQNLTSKSP